MATKTEIPEGREHEFLTDEQLAEHFAARAAEADGDEKADLEVKAAKAKLAAVTTQVVSAEATAAAEAFVAEQAAQRADEQALFDKLVRGTKLTAAEMERAKAYRDAHKG